ncbi:restriction endonuclease subunit S [Vibrio cholerae]|nr:restriction endonuclease subunit S [Vibrio cholerae]
MMELLKSHISVISKGATPKNVFNKRESPTDVAFLKSGNVGDGKLLLNEMSYISKEDHKALSRSSLKNNDVLISIAGGIGKVGVVKNISHPLNTNQANAFIRVLPTLLPDYLALIFRSNDLQSQFEKSTVESAIQNLSMGQIQNVRVNVPSLVEQQVRLERFHKAEQIINSSINLLTQKLHHLEEYKTALIHNAVTKGLDANGKRILDGTPADQMKWKDSGVEWIGEIPDGWDVGSYDSISYLNGYAYKSDLFDNETGVPVIRIGDVGENKTDKKYTGDDGLEVKAKNGDLLLGLSGDVKYSIWRGEDCLLNQRVLSLRSADKELINFIEDCIGFCIAEIMQTSTSTTIKNISLDQVKKFKYPIMGMIERIEISNYLYVKNNTIDCMIETINKKIAFFVEYKKSLINEAVSGQ